MNTCLLIDFGSTYTKLTAVDVEARKILGTSQSWTTVETDIINGYEKALAILKEKTGVDSFDKTLACSSAAGGLRMVAIGLVPELTAKAARQASLGAGAKVIKTYSYELTQSDLREIDEINPDICLLSGGTDGGNKENIIHNAGVLAKSTRSFPIIIAGNRSAADECALILKDKDIRVCENVMPRLDIPNAAPVQNAIREIFLKQIVKAKGLSKAENLIDGILMPTPSAMLTAMELLSKDVGDLLAVDLGGATTDVYSMAMGLPTRGMTSLRGLREEYSKRTVEGDIGMRYSIHGIVEAAGLDRVSELSGINAERCAQLIDMLSKDTEKVPDTQELENLDFALASLAIETAVTRHAGRLEEYYSPMGVSFLQTGKDLTEVKKIVFTGGALIHAKRAEEIAHSAFYSQRDPMSLKPKEAQVLVDKNYILSAMGLLSTVNADAALEIMKKELM